MANMDSHKNIVVRENEVKHGLGNFLEFHNLKYVIN